MASINKEPNGRRTIQFVGADGKRRSVRLGKVPSGQRKPLKVRIEHLAIAAATGAPLEPETAQWVEEREPELLEKLAAVGLIPERAVCGAGGVYRQVHRKPGGRETGNQGSLAARQAGPGRFFRCGKVTAVDYGRRCRQLQDAHDRPGAGADDRPEAAAIRQDGISGDGQA